MTLSQIISIIKKIALDQPNIHSCVDEFIALNTVDAKYSAVILQQQTHRRTNDFIQFNFYLGMADRLNEDKSNEIEVQSTGIQVINNIVSKLENLGFDTTMGSYNVFTERFLAEAAGCYVELSINIPVGECEDDFSKEELNATITANGVYSWIPKGLGFESAKITVNVPTAEIKNQTKEELITINNKRYTYTPDKDYTGIGKLNVMVQIPEQPIYEEGYQQGREDGWMEQKKKLTDISITENGTYTREDGYKSVEVNVPVVNNQEKSITISENGETSVVPDENYTGLSKVSITTDIHPTERLERTYTENGTYEIYGEYKNGEITVAVPSDQKTETELAKTLTENGAYVFTPDDGTVYNKVSITTDIHPTERLERTYVENNTYIIDGEYNGGEITVNVPSSVPDLRETEITPETTEQIITPDGFDGYNKITVRAVDSSIDSEIKPENIKSGVNILGVEGNLEGVNNQEKSITINSNGTSSVIPDTGYTGLSKINITTNVPTSGGDGIDLTSLGYTAQENTSINTDIQDSIAYSQSLLESYTDDTKYEYDSYMMFAPKFPTDKRTTFEKMFFSCGSLKTIPLIDTSNGTNFRCMFDRCSALENIPPINTGKGTNFANMFNYCISLKTIPALDTSNGTNFYGMFDECYTLENIPPINTGKGTDFSYMFVNCQSLTTIPQLDTTNGTNFEFMFDDCQSLTTIPQLDTANGTKFRYMFAISTSLTTIPQLDISNGNDFYYMFGGCSKLTDITFIGSINADISFKDCRRLTYNSIKSILTACSNTATITAKTIEFNQVVIDQNGELQNLVATCTSKGWTIENLTIKTA